MMVRSLYTSVTCMVCILHLLSIFLFSHSTLLLSSNAAAASCEAGTVTAETETETCNSNSLTPPASFDPYAPTPLSQTYHDNQQRVKHLWTTPLLIARPPLSDVSTFNRQLSDRALALFDVVRQRALQKETRNKKTAIADKQATSADLAELEVRLRRGDAASGLNERFFQYQRDQHALGMDAEMAYIKLRTSPEYQSLQKMFDTYAIAFLESVGKSPEWIASNYERGELFCWATIAAHGTYHLAHTHPNHRISGVYYSRIPKDSGTIIFDDPRGPHWPFDGRYIHSPSAGEIVLFPSWLAHQVTPTQGDEQRISWSCNTQGAWDELADVNLV